MFAARPTIKLAVVGAHLSGQPLNGQLTELNATLLRSTKTAPHYRLYALSNTIPPKPGMQRVKKDGVKIAVEVWEMSEEAFGKFVSSRVPPPLTIGTVLLEDNEQVKSFLCENYALEDAKDISSFNGWVSYLNHTGTSANTF